MNRADWTLANIHAVTFNSAGSSKCHNERDDLGESRRQAINNRHTRFKTRHSRNHRNREPLSGWTVDKYVRSNHGSVERIGELVNLKKSFNSARSSNSHNARDD
eukprot:scaffold173698_cov35-Attheya_sp.AAC.1